MKPKCEEPLSNFACFAFNCKLRHYSKETKTKSDGVMRTNPGNEIVKVGSTDTAVNGRVNATA